MNLDCGPAALRYPLPRPNTFRFPDVDICRSIYLVTEKLVQPPVLRLDQITAIILIKNREVKAIIGLAVPPCLW